MTQSTAPRYRPQPAVAIDRSIPFVDAHHHLWELGRLRYDWLAEPGIPGYDNLFGNYKGIRADWGPERLYREFHGQNVIGTVHVEADCSNPDPVDETRWLATVHAEYGLPTAIVAYCDLTLPGADGVLEGHLAASDLVRGIRMRLHPSDPGSSAFAAGFRALVRAGLSYDVNANAGTAGDVAALAIANPSATIIVCHCAWPSADPSGFEGWRNALRVLAAQDNVVIKISGLGMTVDHAWTVESIRPWVLECIEAFGPQRAMFATNWPVDQLYGSYTQQVDAYRQILAEAGAGQEASADLLHRTAARIYRLPTS